MIVVVVVAGDEGDDGGGWRTFNLPFCPKVTCDVTRTQYELFYF